jgi:hypothetical protein
MPLFVDDDVLLVACIDEPPHELEDDLRLRYGVPVRWAITTPLAMNQAIAKYYAPGSRESAAEVATVGKKSAKPGKAKAAKSASAAKVPFSQLPPGEQHEKRLVGIIILCWAFIGSALIDTFVIRNFLITTEWPFFLTLIAAPAAVFYVFRVYWK